ncbi:leucine-rich repeat-containing protein 43-like [Mustelus asterias]
MPEFPIIKCSYFVTYEFLENQEFPSALNESPGKDKLVDTQSEKSLSSMLSSPQPTSPASALDIPLSENDQCSYVFNHKLPQKPWGDPVIYNYSKIHLVKELYALKQLLQHGLTVTVIEEKILSWPIETEEDKIPETPVKGKAHDSAKGGKDSSKNTKGIDNDKEKKKTPSLLQSDPPIQKILGDYHINLHSIVTGNHYIEMVCDLGVPKIEEKVNLPTPDIKETKKGKGAKKKGDDSKLGKDSGASGKSKSKDTPDNKKAIGKREVDSGVLEVIKPKHLFVNFKLQLQKWSTTADAENELYGTRSPFSWFPRT